MFKIFQMGPIFFILGSRKAQFLHFLQAKKRPTFPILRPIKFVAALLFYFPFYSYQLKRYLTPLYFDFIWVITWLLKLSLLKTLKVEFDMCQQIIPLCWKKITFITRIHDLLLCLLLPDCDCPGYKNVPRADSPEYINVPRADSLYYKKGDVGLAAQGTFMFLGLAALGTF